MNDIFDRDQIQCTIDLETLSTEPNACIVSIGAVKFTLNDGITDRFEVNVDPFDCKELGLHISKETIQWWKKQPTEVSDLWKINPQPLGVALAAFIGWYGPRSIPVYANSPSFDCVIMKNALQVVGKAAPWNFRDEVCYRTLVKAVPVKYTPTEKLHSALGDAINQTEHLIKILES